MNMIFQVLQVSKRRTMASEVRSGYWEGGFYSPGPRQGDGLPCAPLSYTGN
jgi:hypothetical protein